MPKPKKNPNEVERKATINTCVEPDVLKRFKAKCKAENLTMNSVFETFMRQYADGEFTLKFVPTEKYAEKYLSFNE
jgi:antitoxin component of RelBE/YafQ-DinJ toxin-antitoxin module